MNALTLCSSCKRHIRVGEPRCPFCRAQAAPQLSAGPAVAARPQGRPGGRAALFLAGAVGATVGAACTTAVPVYGVPVDDDEYEDSADDDEDASSSQDGGSKRDAGTTKPDAAGPPLATPVYGVPIDRQDAAAPKDASSGVDAARDAGLPTPVYGIPIDPRDSGAPACDAGVAQDPARRPAGDAGVDGGDVCAQPPDAGRPIVVPAYGIPVDVD